MSKFREQIEATPDGWDIVADVEAAGLVDEDIRALGREDKLKVRTHPWLPPGQVIAFSPEVGKFR